MTPPRALAFVARHGIVLASAHHARVPSLAEAVAGGPIRGSWWAHPKGRAIFRALAAVMDSPDVLACKLLDGKVTLVHRRLWPALVRLADAIGRRRLAAVRQEHTPRGHHRNVVVPYPRWAPHETRAAARGLDVETARRVLRAAGLEAP